MASSSSSSTMELEQYVLTSNKQYEAHAQSRDLLAASMERLAKRYRFENQAAVLDGTPSRRLQLVDLGSSDGSSSMATLQFA
eukprot:6456700-Ditylum_brightwellii.AAC.1